MSSMQEFDAWVWLCINIIHLWVWEVFLLRPTVGAKSSYQVWSSSLRDEMTRLLTCDRVPNHIMGEVHLQRLSNAQINKRFLSEYI